MIKINKHLYKKSSFTFVTWYNFYFLSIISIPFHIEIAGLDNYGNYIFFHLY